MRYRRLPIEIESPEQRGYATLRCNLTESSIADSPAGTLAEGLGDLLLCYGDHAGLPRLRELIAAQGAGLTKDDVLVAPGAAAALFIANTSLLAPEDRLLVVRPNYSTNIETPRLLGCAVDFLDLSFERGWRLDLGELERRLTPRTTLVSLTVPHNPTGATMTEAELREALALIESRGARALVDETYRELAPGEPLPPAASLSPRAIGVSSLSKAFGLPGIRAGWLACRDRALMETFLAAKEQILICGSVLDEEVAARALERRAAVLPGIRRRIAEHFALVKEWIAGEEDLEWVEPAGGVVCFPRLREGVDVERFYRELEARGTFVGPGHWFEMDRRYFRLGYGWPKTEELREGLRAVSRALAAARPCPSR